MFQENRACFNLLEDQRNLTDDRPHKTSEYDSNFGSTPVCNLKVSFKGNKTLTSFSGKELHRIKISYSPVRCARHVIAELSKTLRSGVVSLEDFNYYRDYILETCA